MSPCTSVTVCSGSPASAGAGPPPPVSCAGRLSTVTTIMRRTMLAAAPGTARWVRARSPRRGSRAPTRRCRLSGGSAAAWTWRGSGARSAVRSRPPAAARLRTGAAPAPSRARHTSTSRRRYEHRGSHSHQVGDLADGPEPPSALAHIAPIHPRPHEADTTSFAPRRPRAHAALHRPALARARDAHSGLRAAALYGAQLLTAKLLAHARLCFNSAHARRLSPRRSALVRARLRHADRRPGGRVAADQRAAACADRRPTGSGKTLAAFLAVIDALLREGLAAGSLRGRDLRRLRLPAEGALERHPQEPRGAACGHPRRTRRAWASRARHPHLRAHRRHSSARARGDAPAPAAHRGDDARVALHPHGLGFRARDARQHPHGDRR